MDRTYVQQTGKTPVFPLGVELWRDVVIRSPTIAQRLPGIMLELIHKERTGETIDRSLMRSLTTV